jgi:hypothetical protein
MTTILRMARALLAVAVLGVPALVAADAPVELCDHEKAQDPTADKSNAKQGDQGKSNDKKSDDKSDQKPDAKESDKS